MTDHPDLAAVVRYLETHQVMSVATHGPDGVWNTAVFYASRGLVLYFVSPEHTRHCRNLERDPRVAVTVHEDYSDWRLIQGVQMAAQAGRVPEAERAAVIEFYTGKFAFLDDPAAATDKIREALRTSAWYCVKPSTVFFVDNARGFGNRIEIPVG